MKPYQQINRSPIQFYAKYRPLLNMDKGPYRTFALTGGRGSMKTGHAVRAVLMAMMQTKKRVVAFREIMRSVQDSLYAEFVALIDGEFAGLGFTYDKQRIYHRNGSQLFFNGLKDLNAASRERLKGMSGVDICIIDEAQSVSKACFDTLLPTLRQEGVILIVIYNRVQESLPVEEALFLEYEGLKAPDKTYFVEVNYPEIAHLGLISTQFIERAELVKQHKPHEYARDYLNQPLGLGNNKAVKYFSRENIEDRIRYVPDLPVHISMDFNVDPMMWICAHKTEDKLFVFDEIVLENTTTADAAQEFLNRYPDHQAPVILNGDASGDYRKTQSKYSDYIIVRNMLRRAGLDVEIDIHPKNPAIQLRVAALNQLVKDINGQRWFFVHPRCEWLIYNLKNLRYKTGTSILDLPRFQQNRSQPADKFLGHIFDAVSYMAEYYWPVVPREES